MTRNDQLIPLLILALAALPAVGATVDLSKLPPAAKQDNVSYAKEIRPIFESSCFRCHGMDKPKAGLRLDSLVGVLKGGKDGKVLVPGNSEKSLLVLAVARLDPEKAMPPAPKAGGMRRGPGGPGGPRGPGGPGGEGAMRGTNLPPRGPMGPPPKPLTPEQVSLVRAWIDQGAR